jgi:hypothetical protein
LNTVGIKTGDIIVSDKQRNVHRLSITEKRSMLKFINVVGSAHPEKSKRLFEMKKLLL